MFSTNEPRLHVIIYSAFPRYSGGRENWLFNILRQLDRNGRKVIVYAYQSDQPVFHDLNELRSVQLVSVPGMRQWTTLYLIANVLTLRTLFLIDSMVLFPRMVAHSLTKNLHDGDVVLAMNPIADIAPALRLRRAGRKFRLACAVRGLAALELSAKMPWLRALFYRLEKETLSQADCILANGYDTQAYLRSVGFESQVIPNGVDVARFTQPDLDDPALAQVKAWRCAGIKIVTMVATLRPIKGIEALLRGAQALKLISPSTFRLVFVGKGDQHRYQRMAAQLGLAEETVFVGEQANVPGFLHYTDVLVCTSGGSGMSMALLEGMAAGRAIVAWDTPVYQQLIEDGESGCLVPFRDYKALARAIKTVLESPALATRLGQAASRIAAEYDWGTVADKLSAVLYE
jgi:glycosyltransferase involved in cell wall biosynthesis